MDIFVQFWLKILDRVVRFLYKGRLPKSPLNVRVQIGYWCSGFMRLGKSSRFRRRGEIVP